MFFENSYSNVKAWIFQAVADFRSVQNRLAAAGGAFECQLAPLIAGYCTAILILCIGIATMHPKLPNPLCRYRRC